MKESDKEHPVKFLKHVWRSLTQTSAGTLLPHTWSPHKPGRCSPASMSRSWRPSSSSRSSTELGPTLWGMQIKRVKNTHHYTPATMHSDDCWSSPLCPPLDSELMGEWKTTRFAPTPKMSTYLFAFTVSELKSTTSPKGRVTIKVSSVQQVFLKQHLSWLSISECLNWSVSDIVLCFVS